MCHAMHMHSPSLATDRHACPLAAVVLAVAADEEKRGRTVKAIELYGTHLRCMAVHCFKVSRWQGCGGFTAAC